MSPNDDYNNVRNNVCRRFDVIDIASKLNLVTKEFSMFATTDYPYLELEIYDPP